jgi:hypothetical protein
LNKKRGNEMVKKVIFALGVVGLLLAGLAIRAQLSKPKTYEPSEVQTLRLQLKQRDTQMAIQVYQGKFNELVAEAQKVKKENGWPDDLKFNADTLQFEMPKLTPLPSPTPAPAKKP